MEKNRICGICNKTFASGKAMGGHMRSHYAKLPISSRINRTQIIDSSSSSSPVKSTSSSSFSDSGSPTRSKRRLRWIARPESPPQSQSVISSGNPDSLSVEEVAMCLVMLSMDKLSTEEARKLVMFKDGLEAEAEQQLVDQRRQSYRCEACEKVFKTYQALGGHRAKTHQKNKKMKICMEQEEQNNSVAAAADDHEEEEEDKFDLTGTTTLFDQSAKAVGEHKKIHFASYLEIPPNKIPTESEEKKFMDLNFPAMDEDEGLVRHTTQITQLHQG